MSIVREGWPFILGCLVLANGLGLGAKATKSPVMALACGVFVLAAAFCAYFFRDPHRVIPQGQGLVLAPADGRVLEIVDAQEHGKPVKVVRIFLSVFNVHLQRSPWKGTVRKITYVPGKFLDARDPKAAFENEQNRIEIESGPSTLVVTQIAGLIARRIVCWVKEGETIEAGQRIGLIRFGSQVDVTLPPSFQINVKPGQNVVSGETVLAQVR